MQFLFASKSLKTMPGESRSVHLCRLRTFWRKSPIYPCEPCSGPWRSLLACKLAFPWLNQRKWWASGEPLLCSSQLWTFSLWDETTTWSTDPWTCRSFAPLCKFTPIAHHFLLMQTWNRFLNRSGNQGLLKHFYFSSPLGFSIGFCHWAAQAFLPLKIRLALGLSYCIYYFITDFCFLCMSKQNSMTSCLPSGLTAWAIERPMQPKQQYFDFTEESSLSGNRDLWCMWFAVSVLVFSSG